MSEYFLDKMKIYCPSVEINDIPRSKEELFN